MDYKEAIKEAETQIDMYESMILYNKDFEPKNDNSNYERKLDFLKTAISAMLELEKYKQLGTLEEIRDAVEKQKRKKPCASNRCYVCPRCGLVTSLRIKHNYCDACGQHIDWSVEE